MPYNNRQVLCVPYRSDFSETGIWPCPKNLFLGMDWRYRTEGLEYDEDWRQIIPYVIVWHDGKVLSYKRVGSEGRLRSLVSFGFGGHVDRQDECKFSPWLTVEDAARRELREELNLPGGLLTMPTRMIVDNSNGVGRVHLGLIYQIFIDDGEFDLIKVDRSEISKLCHRSLDELQECKLENWSGLVLDWLASVRSGGKVVA